MAQPKLVPIEGGFYQARSLIANAQRCLNLLPERNRDGAAVKYTLYPRAGLLTLANPGVNIKCRASYKASNGQLFEVVGGTVYYTDPTFTRHTLGTIANLSTPVSIRDNGIVAAIVDGTTSGYVVNLSTHAFSVISDPAFYGATAVSYTDTYLVFNRPNSTQFYLSPPNWNGTDPFDPLDIADKVGGADPLATLICMKEDIWTLGTLTSMVWYNAGNQDFAFAPVSGVFIEYGCQAVYSVVQSDLAIFWLSQDDDGQSMVVMGRDYTVKRVSTYAIENEIQSYSDQSDAIGGLYQQGGHTFYVLTFPTADKTWVYDIGEDLWHEQCWIDSDGIEHRIRANCFANAYNKNLCGDWENGKLYQLSPRLYTDDGSPISCRRGLPHILNSSLNMSYEQFVAYMQVGSATETLTSDPSPISLRWSDTGGYSWGNPITLSIGSTGQYGIQASARQLGMGRDRVFEVFWTLNAPTAFQGGYVAASPAGS